MRRAGHLAGALAALLLMLFAGCPARAQSTDHYALLMAWMPGLCTIEPDRAECKDLTLRRFDGRNLAFMALQVARSSGIAQTFCFTMPSASEMDRQRQWCDMDAPRVSADLAAVLQEIMPVAKSCQDRALWAKFGSCTLYSVDDYYSRGIKLAKAMTVTKVNTKVAGAAGATVSQQALVEAFEADFGEDSGKAIDFICRRIAGRSHLVQVKVAVTARALTRGLAPELLWKPSGTLRRSCPENILVDAPPVSTAPAQAGAEGAGAEDSGEPAPPPPAAAPPAAPAEPPIPESVPVGPVETAPLEPKKY